MMIFIFIWLLGIPVVYFLMRYFEAKQELIYQDNEFFCFAWPVSIPVFILGYVVLNSVIFFRRKLDTLAEKLARRGKL